MKTIKGIIPPMITPLKGDDQIDREGTVRLTEHILAGGVHALFLLGTTGEAQSLSYKCRYDFVELVCRQVAGRVPVLVGVTDTSLDESVKLAAHAAKCGAVAVVAAAPYYFAPSQQELIEYYTALADALLISLSDSPDLGLTVPGKLASYMAAAKPVLASMNGAGYAAVLESGGGLVSPACDQKALADNMLALYRMTDAERAALGAKAKAYYTAHYRRAELLKRLEEFTVKGV